MQTYRLNTCLMTICAALSLSVGVHAYGMQKTGPPKKSFSNAASNVHRNAPPIQISSSEMADAILADAAHQIYESADEYYHEGLYNHTVTAYRLVEQADPHNMDAYSNAALLLWSTDRNLEAIEQLKLGVEANQDTYYMFDELGSHFWLRMKNASLALPYYEKAVKFQCPWSTWHNLAFCYQKLNRWDKAVEAWRQASKYADDPVAKNKLEQAEAHLSPFKGR